MKAGCYITGIFSIILLATMLASVADGSVYNKYYVQASPISAEKPKVILQQGTAGTSTIYTNNTSAKVSVTAFEREFYKKETINYAWESVTSLISGSRGDDVGVWINLPWNFSYYGVNKTRIYLCSNGFGVFDIATTDYSNTLQELADRKKIAPFWDDLRTDTSASAGIFAENKTSPNRVVIRWNTTRYGASSDIAQFQSVLFSNGTIQFNWDVFVNLPNFSFTSGIGNGLGKYIDVTSDLAANKSIRFTPIQREVGYANHVTTYLNETLTVTTPLSGSRGDDVGVWFTLPWNFSYYGVNKSSIYLCSNGFATFDVAYTGYSNSPSAMANRKMIAPFWDDLRTDVNSYDGIYSENKTNPPRVVFYWRTTRYGDSSDVANFQLVLFQNGTIQFNWVNFVNLPDFSLTSGIGRGDGTCIDVTSEIGGGKSLRFTPNNIFDHVLKVTNQVTDNWKIRLRAYAQSNIGRLYNCTIYFYDGGGVFRQIYIYNGVYSQQFGNWYNLTGLSTVYIAMTVSAAGTGNSYVYVYLEVLVPGTSTYNLMIITFEVS